FNFVGRILGPRGMTAKQLEADTGCKIMVRGRGSMRDKQKEDQNRGKANWEHLDEELHVLIQSVPQGSLIQTTSANGEPNFVQVFGPLQTLDQMGGMLAGGTHLFEYPTHLDPNQAAFPFLTGPAVNNQAGVATRTSNNNAAGNVTQGAAASSASARYQPYTIQSPRLNRT
ncbi:unnamed protein product, partial [Rotaria magnacalcarata]